MGKTGWLVTTIVGVLFLLLGPSVPGYTLSLSIWIVPDIAMTIFLHRRGLMSRNVTIALWVALGTIAVAGTILDLLFARYFFVFPNSDATCGISILGVPIEEFGFYVFGGWFLTLSYVYCDEYWLRSYNRPDGDYRRWARDLPRLIVPSRRGWLIILVAVVGGIAYKRAFNPEGAPIPGYFLFLLAVAYVPFFLVERAVRGFVNWRGYSLTLSVTLGISILWEVTLAIPKGWWGYNEGCMLGIFIDPWHRLPLEAVSVWVFCSFVVLVYEATKMFLHRRVGLEA